MTLPASLEQVQALLDTLQAYGQVRPQPDGSVLVSGRTALGEIEARVSYTSPTLTVAVTKHGFIPAGMIEREIRQALAARGS